VTVVATIGGTSKGGWIEKILGVVNLDEVATGAKGADRLVGNKEKAASRLTDSVTERNTGGRGRMKSWLSVKANWNSGSSGNERNGDREW
jgi:hypothetical protein